MSLVPSLKCIIFLKVSHLPYNIQAYNILYFHHAPFYFVSFPQHGAINYKLRILWLILQKSKKCSCTTAKNHVRNHVVYSWIKISRKGRNLRRRGRKNTNSQILILHWEKVEGLGFLMLKKVWSSTNMNKTINTGNIFKRK